MGEQGQFWQLLLWIVHEIMWHVRPSCLPSCLWVMCRWEGYAGDDHCAPRLVAKVDAFADLSPADRKEDSPACTVVLQLGAKVFSSCGKCRRFTGLHYRELVPVVLTVLTMLTVLTTTSGRRTE